MCVFLFGNEGEEVRFLRSELIQRPRVPQLPTVQTIIAVSEPQAKVGMGYERGEEKFLYCQSLVTTEFSNINSRFQSVKNANST